MNHPESMSIIEHGTGGPPEVLKLAAAPTPGPGDGEVLIRVAFAGVNRPDILQRSGRYPPPPGASPLIGLEVSGEIVALGAGVTAWRVGDRVCALTNGGGYAQYAVAPAGQVLPIPAGLSLEQAAALPETFFTVWSNVFERGRLRAGESLLVHGGSSGIGVTAIQMARARGATVYATAGSAEKVRACVALGASAAINYRSDDFVAEIARLTAGRGVDVVLDMVGGDYIGRNLRCLAFDGRLVQIAFLQGSKAEVDWLALMVRRLTFTGSTLRPQSAAQKAAIADALLREIWPLVAGGAIAAQIFRVFDFAQAAAAHALMESSQHIGKILLRVAGES